MEYSKSVLANMIWKDKGDITQAPGFNTRSKNGRTVYQSEGSDTKNPSQTHRNKEYEYDNDKGAINVHKHETPSSKAFHPPAPERKKVKEIPANAAHEKELKNASQDDLDLEKTRIARKFEHSDAAQRAGHKDAEYYRARAYQTPLQHLHSGGKNNPVPEDDDKIISEHRAASKSEDDFNIEKGKTRWDDKGATTQASGERYKNPKTMTLEKKENPDREVGKHYKMNKRSGDIEVRDHVGEDRKIPANAAHEKELKNASVDSFLNKSFESRTAMPELFFKDKVVRTTTPEENAKIDAAKASRKKFDEGKAKAQGAYRQMLKEGAMKRSYTSDEITVAQLLKGNPQAQAILDELNKGKKNESGAPFQKDDEDTIGSEGHAPVARPDTIKHEGRPSGIGPDEPGTSAKREPQQKSEGDADLEKAIQVVGDFLMEKGYDLDETNEIIDNYFGLEKSEDEDESKDKKKDNRTYSDADGGDAEGKSVDVDFEKSNNFTDNEPEEFEDGLVGADGEDDDANVLVNKKAKKSLTADEQTLNHLLKTMGADRLEDAIKAVIGGSKVDYTKPYKESTEGMRSSAAKRLANSPVPADKAVRDVVKRRGGSPSFGGFDSTDKSTEVDLEKSDEVESPYSLEFSKSILEGLGLLEKGATSVSKEAGGGRATQINYGSKPTTRFKHPKAKSDKKYVHNPAKGTVNVEKEGEKTRSIGVSEQSKLKNASVSSADLYKSLDSILEKGRKRDSDRSAPKRVEESEGEGLELPGGSMATMGNPGGSKEKASFERAEPGTIKNLKKLAESPNKMDRKAAEAGMKRH